MAAIVTPANEGATTHCSINISGVSEQIADYFLSATHSTKPCSSATSSSVRAAATERLLTAVVAF